MTKDKLKALGYQHVRELPNGDKAAIMRQIFTFDLFVGLNELGYRRLYCYEKESDAIQALALWDGQGDPSGPWIKEQPSDRLGPGALK